MSTPTKADEKAPFQVVEASAEIEKKTRDISELSWMFEMLGDQKEMGPEKVAKVSTAMLVRLIQDEQREIERLYRAIAKRSRVPIPPLPAKNTVEDNPLRGSLLATMARSISLRAKPQRSADASEFLERFCRLTVTANAFVAVMAIFNAVFADKSKQACKKEDFLPNADNASPPAPAAGGDSAEEGPAAAAEVDDQALPSTGSEQPAPQPLRLSGETQGDRLESSPRALEPSTPQASEAQLLAQSTGESQTPPTVHVVGDSEQPIEAPAVEVKPPRRATRSSARNKRD